MNTAMNQANDKKNEWADKGQTMMDRAISEVKNINPEDIKRTATELTSKVRDVSAEAYDDAVGYVRRNPVKAAAGLVAVGFVAGVFSGMFRNKSN
jgi:ElaB/YqjD/DUF883 family membrane-anchored ribosome-binding protein